jgi:hypothetical protein
MKLLSMGNWFTLKKINLSTGKNKNGMKGAVEGWLWLMCLASWQHHHASALGRFGGLLAILAKAFHDQIAGHKGCRQQFGRANKKMKLTQLNLT